jgi:hypothetical protein
MKCPVCENTFKYREVPFEDRVIQARHTVFKCPYCSLWLKPAGYYSHLTIGGSVVAFIALFSFIFYFEHFNDVFIWAAPLLAILGVAAVVYGAVTIKLVMLTLEEVTMLPIEELGDLYLDEIDRLEVENSTEIDKDKL